MSADPDAPMSCSIKNVLSFPRLRTLCYVRVFHILVSCRFSVASRQSIVFCRCRSYRKVSAKSDPDHGVGIYSDSRLSLKTITASMSAPATLFLTIEVTDQAFYRSQLPYVIVNLKPIVPDRASQTISTSSRLNSGALSQNCDLPASKLEARFQPTRPICILAPDVLLIP